MSVSLQRFRAWAALLAFSGTFGLGLVTVGHFGPDDDAACGQTALVSGHPGVQFETVKVASPATHCPFCHWQRAVSGARVASAHAAIAPLLPINLALAVATRALGSTAIDAQSPRGPPQERQKA